MDQGRSLVYRFDHDSAEARVPELLKKLGELGVMWKDIDTSSDSLEDIFVDILGRAA